ncbi:MAG TPA: flagellar export chaperone FliS [Bryobacteraceae bacterium]|jgi:flagellar protein FliS|nr:flagellar export chaperone FliS [Bryobacteraceae bacterium]
MWRNAHETYLEERILSADPVELVHLLYQASITAVGDARRHLADGQILARARSISKACDILLELTTSLDYDRGGEMSVRLAQLYGYMHRRLVEANFRQSDGPLAEVAGLLATLMESWETVRAETRRAAAPSRTPWMHAMVAEPELAHASSSWSF